MKKIILLSIFSVISLQFVTAQNYIPLAVEGAHWVVRYDKVETIPPVDKLWEYFATGDTTIAGLTYKKIYKRDLVVTQDGPPFQAEGPYVIFGSIRDDSINKKAFAIQFSSVNQCPENEEYLLYDFSLSVEDTAKLCLIPGFIDFIIEDISTSDVLGFTTRTFKSFQYGNIYEGIGSNFGLFEDMFVPVKKSSDRYVYHTFLDYYCRESPCWLFVSTLETMDAASIKLFPNPAKNFICVSGENNDVSLISVYNNVGQEVIRKNEDLNRINVADLTPGLYIVELTVNKTKIKKKIFIQN